MELSLRLSAIADMVTEGNRLVDVGCDHGYLPVYLIQKKKYLPLLPRISAKVRCPEQRSTSAAAVWNRT